MLTKDPLQVPRHMLGAVPRFCVPQLGPCHSHRVRTYNAGRGASDTPLLAERTGSRYFERTLTYYDIRDVTCYASHQLLNEKSCQYNRSFWHYYWHALLSEHIRPSLQVCNSKAHLV